MRLRALVLSSAMSVLAALPHAGRAHHVGNIVAAPPGTDAPAFSVPVASEPIAGTDVQKMAFDMENAPCEELMKLEGEVREAFLVTSIFLQRKGSLSKIVGPKCMFLGKAERVATIADPALTLRNDRESLYFIADMHVLIVSDSERDSIAYGMIMTDETADPVEYFLGHREEAEQSAAVARMFSANIVAPDPPVATVPELATEIREAPQTSSSASTESEPPARVPLPPSSSSASAGAVGTVSTSTASDGSVQGAPGTAPEEGDEIAALDDAAGTPSIEPLGPEPQPEQQQGGGALWILIAFLALVGIAVLIVVLRNQVSAKQGYIDQ